MNAGQLSQATGCSLGRASKWLEPLLTAMDRFDISTPQRQAAFLAQLAHESDSLSDLEEGFKYKPVNLLATFKKDIKDLDDAIALLAKGPEAVANRVYANQNGNGDEASGDGWRFRGRGLIQLTGKDNYTDCANGIKKFLVMTPDLLLETEVAALSAAWYWWSRGLNSHADKDDFQKTSNIINTGRSDRTANGSEDRAAWWTKAQAALGVC